MFCYKISEIDKFREALECTCICVNWLVNT